MLVPKKTTTEDPNKLQLRWNGHFEPSGQPIAGFYDILWGNVSLGLLYQKQKWTTVDNLIYKTVQEGAYNDVIITPENIAGACIVETTKACEGFTLTLTCPALYHSSPTLGYFPSHQVSVGIYYQKKEDPVSNVWQCLNPHFTISSAPSRSEVTRQVTTQPDVLDLSIYKILVVRLTENHSGSFDYADEIYVKELTEIIYEELAYPHTALLGLKIRATDQLSGSPPTVTSLVKGIKVHVPSNLVTPEYVETVEGGDPITHPAVYNRDGYSNPVMGAMSTTKVWTDNPVWCLYDLLTNNRYGLAEYYKINPDKLGLMQANFYLMAKYCDELVASTDETAPPGIVNGELVPFTRPRFTLNIIIDQTKAASEWVGVIASIMRASLYYSEGLFWIDIDRPKLTTQLFNMSSIKEYTQSGTSYRGIPNTYEVQWINPKASYEIDVFRMESEEFRLNQTLEERKKALLLLGVTNFDQAKALSKYALYAGMYRTKIVSFKTHTAGLRCMVGDVIGIQHDVPQWGWGGKIEAASTNVSDVTTLTLSSPYDVTAANLIPPVGAPEGWQPLTISVCSVAGVTTQYPVLYTTVGDGQTTVRFLHSGPQVGDTYILGMSSNAVNTFKIGSIKRDQDEFVEIQAVEYDNQLFDLCDDTSDLGVWVSTDYSLLETPTRSSVCGVNAKTKVIQDSSGVFKVGMEVFFDVPTDSFWRSADIYFGIEGTDLYEYAGNSTSGYFLIPEIHEEGMHEIVVCSIYSVGKQTVEDALADNISCPYTLVDVSLYIPNDTFMQGVIGLTIANRANDDTFDGKDCTINWRRPISADAVINTEADTTAGNNSSDTWFANYVIEIRRVMYAEEDTEKSNPMPGALKRLVTQTAEEFTYTHDMNSADGAISRTFIAIVTVVDRVGRVSNPKSIICRNPAPAALS